MKEFRAMARLELINIFGINEIRHTKNPREKKRRTMLVFTLVAISVLLLGYSGAGAYAMTTLGLTDRIPMLYFLMAVLLLLGLGLIKSRSRLYREKDLDMISALPVRGIHVVGARILRMYLEGVLITLGILLPSMLVYGISSGAGAAFYLSILPAAVVLAILPTALSAWIGILIAGVIAKSRHKVLAEILITVVLVLGMALFMSLVSVNESGGTEGGSESSVTSQSSAEEKPAKKNTAEKTTEPKSVSELSEEEMKAKMAVTMRNAMDMVEEFFPPARVMGEVLCKPDFSGLLIYAVISLAVLILTTLVIGGLFFRISAKMVTVTRHREYQLESLRRQSVMTALVKKEAARYFSTGIYVANTIVGPVLAVAFAVATAFFDPQKIIAASDTNNLPFDIQISAMLPYLLGMFFVLVSISSSALSMEGRNWWIPRSLPLSAKEILGSKMIFNLMVLAPFYALSEIILLFTMRLSLLERLWLFLIPGVGILFSVLLGMTLNLKFPKFSWDNATEVVKQSAATGLSILGGVGLVLPGVAAMIIPEAYRNYLNLGVLVILCLICLWLYRKICRTRLEKLDG